MAYVTIDGNKYEKELIDLAVKHTTGRGEGKISVDEAKDLFKYHMRKDPNMWITERLDKWSVRNPTTGIGFWVHPTNDPDWIVKR